MREYRVSTLLDRQPMNWIQRFQQLRGNRRRFEPDDARTAGFDAERRLTLRLRGLVDGSAARVWPNRRVPTHRKRRTELDLIVALDGTLVLVELKNWSGELVLHGGDLVQRRRHGMEEVRHGDLRARMAERVEAVQRWCADHGAARVEIEPVIVLANPRLQISEDVITAYDGLLSSEAEFLASMARRVASLSPLTPTALSLHRAIAALSTWDTLVLHGGREVQGDIVDVSFGEALDAKDPRRALGDRRRVAGFDVETPRSFWRLFRGALTPRARVIEREAPGAWLALPPEASLRIRAAGSKQTEQVPLRHVLQVRYGATRRR